MSKIKPHRAFATEKFDRFRGLGQSLLATDRLATDMENFRISSDGTLKKRTGWRTHRYFPGTVRAFWEGTVSQTHWIFAVCLSTVYRIDPLMGTSNPVAELSTSSGRLEFFCFEDTLYLNDGNGLLYYNSNSGQFSAITPYVPLYGKNWDPLSPGAPNEDFNLLTNRVRISYVNSGLQSIFKFPFYVKSIDSLLVDGKVVTDYFFTSGNNYFSLPAERIGYTVEVAVETMLNRDAKGIDSTKRAVVYDGRHHSTLCLYGGGYSYEIYCSRYVSKGSISAAQAHYLKVLPLYFTSENVQRIGDRAFPITSLCPYNNRLLAFTAHSTWEIQCPNDSSNDVSVSLLYPEMGCTAPYGVAICNSKPVFVNHEGIFMMTVPRSENERPTVTRISDGISDLFNLGIAEGCVMRAEPLFHELWIRDPNTSHDRVLVYNYQLGEWYVFTNIKASYFIDLPNFKGFVNNNLVLIFDNTVYTDNFEAITASYLSGYFDFSRPELKKRSLRVTLCKNTPNTASELTLETEHAAKSFEIDSNEADKPDIFDARALMGRFRHLRFRIRTSGISDCRIYSLIFHANL